MAFQGKNPYPRGNFAIIADYLEEIALILANERGLFPVSSEENGNQDIEVTATAVVSLDVPINAVSGSIFFEADPITLATDREIIVRFNENGADPTKDTGRSWGHRDIFNPTGVEVLKNLRFIGVGTDKVHKLRIQFYQTAQEK